MFVRMGSERQRLPPLPAQHEAHLVMRAIETRTGMVRSANLGPAGFVNPVGRFRARTAGPEAGVVTARVDAVPGHTWFVRLGDVAGSGAAVAVLLLFLATRPRRPGIIDH